MPERDLRFDRSSCCGENPRSQLVGPDRLRRSCAVEQFVRLSEPAPAVSARGRPARHRGLLVLNPEDRRLDVRGYETPLGLRKSGLDSVGPEWNHLGSTWLTETFF